MAKAPLKKKKKDKSTTWYRNKADTVFSVWIRKRDSDWRGNVQCFTCPKVKPWNEVDNGHYISRRHLSVRYDEQNAHGQCKECNGFNAGRTDVYALNLIRKYGQNILIELAERKAVDIKETKDFYKSIIEKYKSLTNPT